MSSGISPENEAFLQRQVALGKTRDEVIDQGLTLLRSRQKLLASLDEGRRQLDEGEYREYDDRELDAFFAGLPVASVRLHGAPSARLELSEPPDP